MAIENGKPVENGKPCELTVKVTGTTTVRPAKKPEAATCPLSTFDLPYITFYYNQKLVLYKTSPEQQFSDSVGKLRDGLAEALGYFYPLAGRLSQDEENVLVVKCDGEEGFGGGVEVLEAAAEGVEVAELAGEGGDQAEKKKILQELIPYTGVMNLEGLHRPLLAVQVRETLHLLSFKHLYIWSFNQLLGYLKAISRMNLSSFAGITCIYIYICNNFNQKNVA